MKKLVLLILALLPFIGAGAQVVFKNDDVTVSKLKDKTWVFETWDYTTMYLLEGNDRAALIDAGTRCADLDKIVEGITSKPYDVIITHAHPDHAGCIGYFDEVWMHRNDSVLIKERTNRAMPSARAKCGCNACPCCPSRCSTGRAATWRSS